MKAFLLPRDSNRELFRLILEQKTKPSFFNLVNRLSVFSRSQRLQKQKCMGDLLLLINRILIMNVYKYIEKNSTEWFVKSLSYRTFGGEVLVENYHVGEFVESIAGMTVSTDDMCEVEGLVSRELAAFIYGMYCEETEKFNIALFAIFETLSSFIPHTHVNIRRFEVTSTLEPLVFYTEPEQSYESLHLQGV